MLRCGDGSLYTGWTNDIEHRVKMHSEGKGGKYTRALWTTIAGVVALSLIGIM